LAILGVSVVPDFCIDDYEEIITAFGGVTVKPYFGRDGKDREMERVYEAICNYTIP
ncbi:MAG: hypothetical protein HY677_06990, partial [Chloroflexi bacterium]|nr:hypothetical protein [Chloroflexota bacterium]